MPSALLTTRSMGLMPRCSPTISTEPGKLLASCARGPSDTTRGELNYGIASGGFKQSGIGREGGTEGLLPFLETKTVILNGRTRRYGGPTS